MSAIEYVGSDYLTCAETAKLVRAALKQEFPGTKFSVRSSTYSGGASIDISWTDGPTSDRVDRVAGMFAGADFDGMIDMKCHTTHWLEPDGTVKIAHAQGTENSRGYLPEIIGDPPGPSARLVSFGADYVFAHRNYSPEFTDRVLTRFEAVLGRELPRNDREWCGVLVPLAVDRRDGRLHHMVETDTEALSTVLRQYLAVREVGDGFMVNTAAAPDA